MPLPANPGDALEGLRSEGILNESRNPEADYVLYFARSNNVPKADRRYESSSRLFDVERDASGIRTSKVPARWN